MKLEEFALALIDAFCGGGASLAAGQLRCSPAQIEHHSHQLKGLGESAKATSWGVRASCTTGTGHFSGEASKGMANAYNQQTEVMKMISEGLQGLADKAKGVSEFIRKAQTYLKGLLEKFRAKIMSLLGSWIGMLVVAAVAFLAVKLIKSLINKVAGKLGVAGAAIRAAGDKLASSIQQTLTAPKKSALPEIAPPQKIALPAPATPPGGPLPPLPPVVDNTPPPPPPPNPVGGAKPLTWVPNVLDNKYSPQT